MNYTPGNNLKLRSRYLKMAYERLDSAGALLERGNLEDAISRSYYAILDAAGAALIMKDIIPQSHQGAIRLFGLHFIKTGKVSAEYGRLFKQIEKARLEADYTHEREFTFEEAEKVYQEAAKFVEIVGNLLRSEETTNE